MKTLVEPCNYFLCLNQSLDRGIVSTANFKCVNIKLLVQDHGLNSQCGSLNSKGCPDALFSLKSALQICRERNLAMRVLRKFGIPAIM
eukprot:9908922-Ditylum_brightwellii.AAC.1